jgi:hypothetical protein
MIVACIVAVAAYNAPEVGGKSSLWGAAVCKDKKDAHS